MIAKKYSPAFVSTRTIPLWIGVLFAFLVGLSFTGFPAVSFLSLGLSIGAEESRALTVPYRIFVLTLSIFAFAFAWQQRRLEFRHTTHRLLLLFWAIYVFRLIYEIGMHEAELTMPVYYLVSYAIGICFASSLGFLQALDERTARLAPWMVWGLALTANFAGLIFSGNDIVLTQRSAANELFNPISFGQCAVTQILMSGYLGLRSRSAIRVITLFLLSLPAFYNLAVAASRSPLLSLAAGGVLVAVYGYRFHAKYRAYTGSIISIIALFFGYQFLTLNDSALTNRVGYTIDDLRYGGEVDRFVLWRAALEQYLESPVIGQGIEIHGAGYPHNLAIEALMTTGIVGGLLFLGIIWSSINDARILMKQRNVAWLPLLAAQFFVLAAFSGSLYSSPEFWCVIFLQAGTVGALHRSSAQPLPAAMARRNKLCAP